MVRHVLVVEDEPLIRMDAVSMLETAGLSVVEFDRADAAFDFTKAHPEGVAAVFTDINLRGEMDGLELAREVNQADPSIAVVVTSGRLLTRPATLPASVTFVMKPWLPLEVIGMMQDAVAR